MNTNKKLAAIKADMDEITGLLDYFEQHDSSIPVIELDLLLEKLREVYHQVLSVKIHQVDEGKMTDSTIVKKEHKEETREKTAETSAIITDNSTELEDAVDFIVTDDVLAVEEVDMQKDSIKLVPEDDQKIVADKFRDNKSINEALAEKSNNKDLSAKIQGKAVKDLTKAFGVNDKFLYTKELFKGDKEKFQQTLLQLNGMKSFEEAVSWLEAHFQWEKDNSVAINFLDIVKRKYS